MQSHSEHRFPAPSSSAWSLEYSLKGIADDPVVEVGNPSVDARMRAVTRGNSPWRHTGQRVSAPHGAATVTLQHIHVISVSSHQTCTSFATFGAGVLDGYLSTNNSSIIIIITTTTIIIVIIIIISSSSSSSRMMMMMMMILSTKSVASFDRFPSKN